MSAAVLPGGSGIEVFCPPDPLHLEGGRTLERLQIAYETWGELDPAGDNAVLICHALTGSSHAAGDPVRGPGWWDGLVGPGKVVDPATDFVVAPNLLGSCYGSSGPSTCDLETGTIPGISFPRVTTRDMVRAQRLLLDHLGVRQLRLVIGGSLGGMVTWQWLVEYPEMVQAAVPIAATAQASAWQIALNQVAREAIFNDPEWHEGRYFARGPEAGLALARMIAMISYRSEGEFRQRFGRSLQPSEAAARGVRFAVEGYLRHHGHKLVERFDARSYVTLTRAMDSHDVARGHTDLDRALARVTADVLAIGIDTDVLFPAGAIRETVHRLRGLGARAGYAEISSTCGHDAFLIELDQLDSIIRGFLPRRLSCAC